MENRKPKSPSGRFAWPHSQQTRPGNSDTHIPAPSVDLFCRKSKLGLDRTDCLCDTKLVVTFRVVTNTRTGTGIGEVIEMEKFMLEAALTSLTIKKAELDAQIGMVENMLAGRSITTKTRVASKAKAPANADGTPRRVARVMSKAGRERIAEAQRKRWGKVRREKKAAEKVRMARKISKKDAAAAVKSATA